MDAHVKDVVRDLTRVSDEEQILFPDVVKALMDVGVERYHADLVKHEKTYYTPAGQSFVVASHPCDSPPGQEFLADQIEAAVRASQRRQIGYREFCRRALQAGCAGYWVSIAGKRAVYYGRTGETHVELFPASTS